MKSLIIGMGFGGLYQKVLTELGYEVYTVDPVKPADFKDVDDALYQNYDTVNICTPNDSHETLARAVAPHAKIIFVEKPGVYNAVAWQQLHTDFPDTRFIMTKNNQWRDNIQEMRGLVERGNHVRLHWINQDRVPNPGSWFTNKQRAFGGVSRDLMPHLLSIFMKLEPDYAKSKTTLIKASQRWHLSDIGSSDYGQVMKDGVYDVDDHAVYSATVNGRSWVLDSNWRSLTQNDVGLHVNGYTIELGLCPEEAYKAMIVDCTKNLDNNEFWSYHYNQDIYIHRLLEKFDADTHFSY
jgi:predicted dehydrogenase